MQRHFDQDLLVLREKLLTMASHAEQSVNLAMKALVERDDDLARQVKAADATLDQFEIDMDELAIKLLALKAPVAGDLRLIKFAKVNGMKKVILMIPEVSPESQFIFENHPSSKDKLGFRRNFRNH